MVYLLHTTSKTCLHVAYIHGNHIFPPSRDNYYYIYMHILPCTANKPAQSLTNTSCFSYTAENRLLLLTAACCVRYIILDDGDWRVITPHKNSCSLSFADDMKALHIATLCLLCGRPSWSKTKRNTTTQEGCTADIEKYYAVSR